MFYVYELSKNGKIIYIGCTDDLQRRLRQHLPKQFDDYNFTQYESREEALSVEALLIEKHRPPLNKIHNPDRSSRVCINAEIIGVMNDLTKTEIVILLKLATYRDRQNKITMGRNARNRFIESLGIAPQAFINNISKLKKKGLIIGCFAELELTNLIR